MAIHVVRLGTPRLRDEGLRIGTVRRPPRGVPKRLYAAQNWYDVWLPDLAPSAALLATAKAASGLADWRRFEKRYRAELARPEAGRLLNLLAALSLTSNFSVGCYCEDERTCHRRVLREVLRAHGARVTPHG
jgi:uncharacterized protein YeaO (DUF488 family)